MTKRVNYDSNQFGKIIPKTHLYNSIGIFLRFRKTPRIDDMFTAYERINHNIMFINGLLQPTIFNPLFFLFTPSHRDKNQTDVKNKNIYLLKTIIAGK